MVILVLILKFAAVEEQTLIVNSTLSNNSEMSSLLYINAAENKSAINFGPVNLFSGASIQNGGTMLTSIVNSRVKLMKFTVLVFTLMPTAFVVTIMSLGNFKYNVNL